MTPWAMHPMGRGLLQDIINHYTVTHDIQTIAMISCIFGNKSDSAPRLRKKNSKSECYNVTTPRTWAVMLSLSVSSNTTDRIPTLRIQRSTERL